MALFLVESVNGTKSEGKDSMCMEGMIEVDGVIEKSCRSGSMSMDSEILALASHQQLIWARLGCIKGSNIFSEGYG